MIGYTNAPRVGDGQCVSIKGVDLLSLSLRFGRWLLLCLAVCAFSAASTPIGGEQTQQILSRIYSSDGLFVAYIKRESSKPDSGHVWLESTRSHQLWRLTDKARPFVGLTFTPDGQSVTFLSRESGSDSVGTFDVNFKRGLASVIYNELTFEPGQIISMPMWLDDDKLAYLSQSSGEGVLLMQWSLSRGKHELLQKL